MSNNNLVRNYTYFALTNSYGPLRILQGETRGLRGTMVGTKFFIVRCSIFKPRCQLRFVREVERFRVNTDCFGGHCLIDNIVI